VSTGDGDLVTILSILEGDGDLVTILEGGDGSLVDLLPIVENMCIVEG
jgi:hypothetical protein